MPNIPDPTITEGEALKTMNLKLECYGKLVDHALKTGVLKFEAFGFKVELHPAAVEGALAERVLKATDVPLTPPPTPPKPEEDGTKDWLAQMAGN